MRDINKMRAIGFFQLVSSPKSSGEPPDLSIKQIWPTRTEVQIHPNDMSNVLTSIPANLGASIIAHWADFLATTAVTYDTDGTLAAHITIHPNCPIPSSTEFEWCPTFPVTSPFQLESLVNENHPPWLGPQPADKSSDIHAIANEKYVVGLGVRKQGKTFQIVKKSPLSFQPIPKRGRIIIQDDRGWFISQSQTAESDAPTENKPPVIEFLPEPRRLKSKEQDAFIYFEQLVRWRGLAYDRNDLILLYCSLRAGQFVILSGTGGIGKSSLAIAVADFLQCSIENQRLAWLPVEPSWISSEQLMGHYDARARLFRPANGNLADVLVHANQDSHPRLVCLDELNLARVEHYLAPLLSLKEHSNNTVGWSLYPTNHVDECLNRQKYPSSVPIGNNVLWMGTVNMDEASYGLTDKFLDRATYIALRQTPFSQRPGPRDKPTGIPNFPIENPTPVPLSQPEVDYFDQLNRLTRRPLLGWRTLDAMQVSIGAIPTNNDAQPIWDLRTAWDEHFVTRILSKFHGTGMEWECWKPSLPQLREHLKTSPWGVLERSLAVLAEIEESKEPRFVI